MYHWLVSIIVINKLLPREFPNFFILVGCLTLILSFDHICKSGSRSKFADIHCICLDLLSADNSRRKVCASHKRFKSCDNWITGKSWGQQLPHWKKDKSTIICKDMGWYLKHFFCNLSLAPRLKVSVYFQCLILIEITSCSKQDFGPMSQSILTYLFPVLHFCTS